MTDQALVREYVAKGDQQAFAELVRRHAGWVHACARREVGDEHLAEDVTQAVFILVCQKARTLARRGQPAAWLFRVTRYCSANALRQRGRRRKHERKAAMRRDEQAAEQGANWEEIWPVLDEAVGRLRRTDREAVLLRFYRGMSLGELAVAVGIGEEAAKKRVQRAVEKLRGMLEGQGVTAGATGLGVVMAERVTEAMDAGAVQRFIEAAKGGGAGAAGLIAKGAMKMIAWAKAKVAAG